MTSGNSSNDDVRRAESHSTSRREFIARSSSAAAVAGVVGATSSASLSHAETGGIAETLRAKPRAGLDEGAEIRMGVIGTGGMGTAHCRAMMSINKAEREKVKIVALADVCKPRLENAHEACTSGQGIAVDMYRDYRELLDRDDIHGVLIASPEHWHAQMAIDALLAGKDVYVEKPMTLRLPDAVRLHRVAKHNLDMILQIGTQKMMLPKYEAARKLIAEGAIGKPTFSQTSYCRNNREGEWLYYAIDPNVQPGEMLDWDGWCGPLGAQPWDTNVYHRWRRYSKFSTGIIGDLLVHVMTPLMMSLDVGWPTRITAAGGHYYDKAMDNFDQVNLTIEFEKEHTMIVAGSTCNEIGLETMIRGNQATLYLGGRNCVLRPERAYANEVDEQTVELPAMGNDQDELRINWLGAIRSRGPVASPVDMAIRVMVAVDLAARSMWEGHAFAFDPKSMTAQQI